MIFHSMQRGVLQEMTFLVYSDIKIASEDKALLNEKEKFRKTDAFACHKFLYHI